MLFDLSRSSFSPLSFAFSSLSSSSLSDFQACSPLFRNRGVASADFKSENPESNFCHPVFGAQSARVLRPNFCKGLAICCTANSASKGLRHALKTGSTIDCNAVTCTSSASCHQFQRCTVHSNCFPANLGAFLGVFASENPQTETWQLRKLSNRSAGNCCCRRKASASALSGTSMRSASN